ncbi:hypothetical protein [Microcoleus sp. T2B6]|uniref:hypothetical protein n=1 Tax=Microcoleus sp. T2B6 TaxID=3055424 RepID=UPI002FD65F82
MITDEDLTPIDLSDFWEDEEDSTEAPELTARTGGVDPDYIQRHIDRIPHYGDDSRYRLASHLDMFEQLNPDGSLTDEQRQAVDNFAIGWAIEHFESGEGNTELSRDSILILNDDPAIEHFESGEGNTDA